MLHEIFFCKKWGGAFLLLLLNLFSLIPFAAKGQDNCVQPPCNKLSLEVIKRTQNVSPGCSPAAQCADDFHQVAFDVYLRYRSTSHNPFDPPPPPVSLNYSNLDVTLKLSGMPQFSRIDVPATQTCFANGVGANWLAFADPNQNNTGDGVVFTPTENEVSISFANMAPGSPDCGASGPGNATNVIRLAYNSPQNSASCGNNAGDKCAYALLFTIIVNTFPGEAIGVEFVNRSYTPKGSISPGCTQIEVKDPPNGFNGLVPVVIANPNGYLNSANEALRARFSPGGASLTVPGGTDYKINLENIGSTSLTVNYVEFVVKAELLYLDNPLVFSGAVPNIIDGGTNPATGATIKYLHFIIYPNTMVSDVSTLPNNFINLCTITQTPPTLSNVNWSISLSFLQLTSPTSPGTKSRISSSDACTELQFFPGDIGGSNSQGNSFCSDPSIHFKVEGQPYTCGQSKVRVSLKTTAPPAYIQLSKIEFSLEFVWPGSGYAIAGVDYPSWPIIPCQQIGCYVSPLGQRGCWNLAPNDRTFNYCFSTDDANAQGFTLNDLAAMDIVVNTPTNGCIPNVIIRTLRLTYANSNYTACIPVIEAITGFPLCDVPDYMITGKIATETSEPVSDVVVLMTGADQAGCQNVVCLPGCSVARTTPNDGQYQFFCGDCASCNKVKITPTKDDNHLNGVTTYDLVLISKHILGIEPLGSFYKIIAADANNDTKILTSDIVELRKLILGIYQELPNIDSWRFVDKAFPPPNPLPILQLPSFPESINCLTFPAAGVDFVAVKVGDVNNTAVSHSRPAGRPLATISWPSERLKKGEVVTLPISYSGSHPMEAIQMGIRFDPGQLQLIGPSQGDIPSYLADNFNLQKAGEGEIRTLWLSMTGEPEMIQANTVLFYLSFKVLREANGEGLPIWLDRQLLDCAAWSPEGTEYALQASAAGSFVAQRSVAPALVGLKAILLPNPTASGAVLQVQAQETTTARIAVFDAFGRQLVFREQQLQAGSQDIAVPEIATFPAGVYLWKVYTRTDEAQGHLVKQ